MFAQEAGIAPGGCRIEDDPERFPATPGGWPGCTDQTVDRAEEAYEGDAGPCGHQQPQQMLDRTRGAGGRQPARSAVIDPAEQPAPQGLRTGVAAPEPPGQVGEQYQRGGQHGGQTQQEADVVRPERPAEQIEAARGQVEQQRLPTLPAQPGQGIETGQQQRGQQRPPTQWRASRRGRGCGRCIDKMQGEAVCHGHPSGRSSSSLGIGRSRYQVIVLAAAVTAQNMKNPSV